MRADSPALRSSEGERAGYPVGVILLVVFVIVALAVAVRLGLPVLQRRRIAAELRGDWWTRFEREFRAYASRSWKSARDSEQRT